eukprot:gene621-1738_t
MRTAAFFPLLILLLIAAAPVDATNGTEADLDRDVHLVLLGWSAAEAARSVGVGVQRVHTWMKKKKVTSRWQKSRKAACRTPALKDALRVQLRRQEHGGARFNYRVSGEQLLCCNHTVQPASARAPGRPGARASVYVPGCPGVRAAHCARAWVCAWVRTVCARGARAAPLHARVYARVSLYAPVALAMHCPVCSRPRAATLQCPHCGDMAQAEGAAQKLAQALAAAVQAAVAHPAPTPAVPLPAADLASTLQKLLADPAALTSQMQQQQDTTTVTKVPGKEFGTGGKRPAATAELGGEPDSKRAPPPQGMNYFRSMAPSLRDDIRKDAQAS